MKTKGIKGYDIIFLLLFVVFFLLCILLLYSNSNFYTAQHNIDIGQNIMILNAEHSHLTFLDTGSDFNQRDGTTMYILGMNKAKESYLSSIILSTMIGFVLCLLLFMKRPPYLP